MGVWSDSENSPNMSGNEWYNNQMQSSTSSNPLLSDDSDRNREAVGNNSQELSSVVNGDSEVQNTILLAQITRN